MSLVGHRYRFGPAAAKHLASVCPPDDTRPRVSRAQPTTNLSGDDDGDLSVSAANVYAT